MFSENLCTLLKILNCLTSRIFGAVDHEHVGPHVKSIDSGRILNSCDCASSKDKVHIYIYIYGNCLDTYNVLEQLNKNRRSLTVH